MSGRVANGHWKGSSSEQRIANFLQIKGSKGVGRNQRYTFFSKD